MKLRRTVLIAAAATAVLATTTAAMFPPSPPERSQPLPALTTKALTARYAADAGLVTRAARSI